MKKTVLLLLLLTAFSSFCQITYQPGYFINNSGAKTNCLIKNIAWKDNPTRFDYKLTETGDALTADIAEAAEFSIPGYKFTRYNVNIDRSEANISNMSFKKDPEFKKETLYLKVLVEGKATLYHYVDNNITRFFYTNSSLKTPEQLVYKEYKIERSMGVDIAKNEFYKQQLYNALKDGIADAARYKDIKYEEGALIKLFKDYGGNAIEDAKDKSSGKNKLIINIKITPGVNFASLSLRRPLEDNLFKLDTKEAYRLGAEFELVLPVNNHKWSVFIDPNFSSYKNSGTQNYTGNQSNTWNADYKFIEIPVGVRHYMYLNKKAKFFIDAAYVPAFSLGSSVDIAYSNGINGYSSKQYTSNTSNAAFGGGFSYGRYSAEVRYSLKRNILNDYVAWNGKYSSVGIILGFKVF